MNLKELKTAVDSAISRSKNPEKIEVFITLADTGIGARAGSKVQRAGMGIDLESSQFRIEPVKKLTAKKAGDEWGWI